MSFAGSSWAYHLPWDMLGLRAAAFQDIGVFSAQAVFGTAVSLPGQFSQKPEMDLDDFLKQLQMALVDSK